MRSTKAMAVLATVLALGCGRNAKTKGPYAKDVAQAIPMIEKATGLRFKRQPVLQERTKEQVRQFLETRFTQELPAQVLEGEQVLYRRLGLIPDTLDLRKYMLDLLTEQVVGFYDPKTKTLYVVKGAPHDEVSMIVSHELVHALQDQYVNLDSIQDIRGESDRSLAAQAVIEGQATIVPLQALLGPGASMPAGWDRVREMIRQNRAQMPVFAAAPFVLQETLIFPYLSGAEFMRRFEAERPGKSPFDDMPTSTEQILHAQADYFTHREPPTEVTLPKPATGTLLDDDDMGEFETRLFLFQHLQDQGAAVRGAQGWAGDRYEVVRTPRGDALLWLTVWDSPVDAAEFSSDVEQVMGKRFPGVAARDAAGGKRWAVPGKRAITLWGGTVQGRPAVLYSDLPDGVEPNLLDLKKVRLETLAR